MEGLPYALELISALKEVRAMLMPHFGNVPYEAKSGNAADIVTEWDQRAEDYLRERLTTLDPGASVVGEESGGDRSADRLWLIDPIDGTGNYVRGRAYCTTMLALVEYGVVTASLIYDFVRDELYRAERGLGATCNGRPLRVSNREGTDAYVGWEMRLGSLEDLGLFLELKRRVTLQSTVSAGHEYAMIAAGKLEGRICLNPYGQDYDFAPGALLVKEAGGCVANIGSRSYDYRNLNFIAANPRVFEALTQGPNALFPITEPNAPQ
jgi:myo-inositol-1(or 4)-monophosphatase